MFTVTICSISPLVLPWLIYIMIPVLEAQEVKVTGYLGDDVTLPCQAITRPEDIIVHIQWELEQPDGKKISIMYSYGQFEVLVVESFLKERVEIEEQSLIIRDVEMRDAGTYICRISAFPSGSFEGTTNLQVKAGVANVMVTSNTTDMLEYSTVRLSCSSSRSFLSFLWLNGSSEITESDRVQLTDGGSTLTIVSVTRYDQGPFRCQVSNPVSNGTSGPVNLSINYGPDNINLTISPSQEHYEEGSNITLTCSADSTPDAQYTWFLNGDLLSDTGPELRLMNIQESKSWNYSCQAFNSRTQRSINSQPAAISVLKRLSDGLTIIPGAMLILPRMIAAGVFVTMLVTTYSIIIRIRRKALVRHRVCTGEKNPQNKFLFFLFLNSTILSHISCFQFP
ncbi:cell adhesion molecule CEACAM6-like [Anarhichas minor]|uniref:cell adhesion molecule CEACAM6-like n=1 Tax=Anarhichas minor TaxID=65739 RepID=UPI003F739DF5